MQAMLCVKEKIVDQFLDHNDLHKNFYYCRLQAMGGSHKVATHPAWQGGKDPPVASPKKRARFCGNIVTSLEIKMSASESRKRNKTIRLRVDDDEHVAIHEHAQIYNVSASHLLRMYGVKKRSPRLKDLCALTKEDRQQLARLLNALARIGGNVNQIAHAMNLKNFPPSSYVHETFDDLADLRRLIRSLLTPLASNDR